MFFGRFRNLVAMATSSSHRIIMGKVEICNFFCLNGNIFLQKCLLSSPVCFISSPEPKAQGELIVYQSSRRLPVCLCVYGHFQTQISPQPVGQS